MREQRIKIPSDTFGWLGYLFGFCLALSGRNKLGTVFCAASLLFLCYCYASNKEEKDLLDPIFNRWQNISLVILFVFIIAAFLKIGVVVILCIGMVFFLGACVSLKRGVVYYGNRLTPKKYVRVKRQLKPLTYWVLVTFEAVMGGVSLVIAATSNRWY